VIPGRPSPIAALVTSVNIVPSIGTDLQLPLGSSKHTSLYPWNDSRVRSVLLTHTVKIAHPQACKVPYPLPNCFRTAAAGPSRRLIETIPLNPG
jgi:hypothetical protein